MSSFRKLHWPTHCWTSLLGLSKKPALEFRNPSGQTFFQISLHKVNRPNIDKRNKKISRTVGLPHPFHRRRGLKHQHYSLPLWPFLQVQSFLPRPRDVSQHANGGLEKKGGRKGKQLVPRSCTVTFKRCAHGRWFRALVWQDKTFQSPGIVKNVWFEVAVFFRSVNIWKYLLPIFDTIILVVIP